VCILARRCFRSLVLIQLIALSNGGLVLDLMQDQSPTAQDRSMKRPLIVAIALIGVAPSYAQGTQSDIAKLKADAQKVVSVVKGDKAIGQIIRTLTALVRAGQLPDFAVVAGWRGKRPANANEFVDDDAAVGVWAASRYAICVRVAPRGSGKPRVDSDLLR
jgi:hypothetical protein